MERVFADGALVTLDPALCEDAGFAWQVRTAQDMAQLVRLSELQQDQSESQDSVQQLNTPVYFLPSTWHCKPF